jgi:hypothetical protein
MPGEASGFFEFYLHGSLNSFSVQASKQNIDMVQLARHDLDVELPGALVECEPFSPSRSWA